MKNKTINKEMNVTHASPKFGKDGKIPYEMACYFGIIPHILSLKCHILGLITKTCLYNFDPLKHHLYILKLGFTRVYIIFLISAQNIHCVYSLEPPRRF